MTHNKKSFFTLAEVLATLVILGVVAAITIPSTITRVRQREFVTKAKKTYAALEQATEIWMVENNCIDNIEACTRRYPAGHGAFDDIARNLNVVETTDYKYVVKTENCNNGEEDCVNGKRTIKNAMGENLNRDWLPDRTTNLNGSLQTHSWYGVSKYTSGINQGGGDNNTTGLYLLKDGTTISVQMPDDRRRSGFGFFDVNGRKGPNQVGVDVYPIGWGIPYNNANQRTTNETRYGSKARGFNPYFTEDDGWGGQGICAVRNGSNCPDDNRNNPTAWLLIHNEIPKR